MVRMIIVLLRTAYNEYLSLSIYVWYMVGEWILIGPSGVGYNKRLCPFHIRCVRVLYKEQRSQIIEETTTVLFIEDEPCRTLYIILLDYV